MTTSAIDAYPPFAIDPGQALPRITPEPGIRHRIKSGYAIAKALNANAKIIVLHHLTPGDIIPLAFLQTDITIEAVNTTQLEALHHPPCEAVRESIERQAHLMAAQARILGAGLVTDRVQQAVTLLAHTPLSRLVVKGTRIDTTHDFIALVAATSRVTATRVLGELEDDGILKRGLGCILVKHPTQ